MLSVCDRLNLSVVGGKSFFQYDGVRSFANVLFIEDSIFAYKQYTLSPYFIDHTFYGINMFPPNKAVEFCV